MQPSEACSFFPYFHHSYVLLELFFFMHLNFFFQSYFAFTSFLMLVSFQLLPARYDYKGQAHQRSFEDFVSYFGFFTYFFGKIELKRYKN